MKKKLFILISLIWLITTTVWAQKTIKLEPEFNYIALYKGSNLLEDIAKGKLDWKDLDWKDIKHVFEITINENDEIVGDIMKYMFIGEENTVIPAKYRFVSNIKRGKPIATMHNASEETLLFSLFPDINVIVVSGQRITQVFTNNLTFINKTNTTTRNNTQQNSQSTRKGNLTKDPNFKIY